MTKSKEELRKEKLNLRKKLTLEWKKKSSEKIIQTIKELDVFQQVKSIMLYCSHQNEIDLNELIEYSLKQGKEVLLPTINKKKKEIEPYLINDISKLTLGPHLILEPKKENQKPYKKKIDLILVPGIVFDNQGNRIGYGQGYYDKFLLNNQLSTKIGIAYDFQIIKQIKEKFHDISMNFIISEKKIINCKNK